MIAINLPQKSLDWIIERLWRLTASEMDGNITAKGALSRSQAAILNIDRMIAGHDAAKEMIRNPQQFDNMDDWQIQNWLAHYTGKKFCGNLHTTRGNDLEPDAIAALADRLGVQIEDVGLCVMGNNRNGVVSCSPDGLIRSGGKVVSGAEVKAPMLATFYNWVADGVLPSDHYMQVHASMVICETDYWNFGAYFKGKPLFHVPVKRDTFTDTLEKSLNEFHTLYAVRFAEVQEALAKLEPEKEELL
jgi:hypothetical protein